MVSLRNNGIVIDTETKGVIDAMCTLEEHFINKGRKEGRKEGRQEAKQETKVEIARKMLNEGLTLDMIKTCTGLTIQMIREIAASLKRTVASHPSGSLA